MNFIDGSLYPENQEKLVITVAPYGPQFEVSDFPEDIPVTKFRRLSTAMKPVPLCCTCMCANSTAKAQNACPSSTN